MAASKRQIDLAGERVEKWWLKEPVDLIETDRELLEAVRILLGYRQSHQYPLRKVTVGVRQFVARESSEVIVGQRLKRLPTILNKLTRHAGMKSDRISRWVCTSIFDRCTLR